MFYIDSTLSRFFQDLEKNMPPTSSDFTNYIEGEIIAPQLQYIILDFLFSKGKVKFECWGLQCSGWLYSSITIIWSNEQTKIPID